MAREMIRVPTTESLPAFPVCLAMRRAWEGFVAEVLKEFEVED